MTQVKTAKDTIYFPKGSKRYDFVHELENAGIAQFITRTLLAPIERWRLFSQTQNSLNSGFIRYKGFNEFIQGTIKKQGVKGLWRSNAANCWLYFYQLTCQHLFYENINYSIETYFLKQGLLSSFNQNTTLKTVLKVIATNFATLLVTYPIETARVRIALNTPGQAIKQLPFRGVMDCLRYTSLQNRNGFRNNTYRGLLFGNFTSLIYFSTYSTLYQASLEDSKISDRKQFNLIPLTFMGSLPAILLTYPLDTLKHRLQLNSKGQGNLTSIRSTVNQMLKQPFTSYYKGLLPSLAKHVLSAPIFFGILNLKYKNNWNYF